jgi:hypothetical protein
MDDEYERCADGVRTEEVVAYQQFAMDQRDEPAIPEERISYISGHINDCERCSRIYREVEETNKSLGAAFGKTFKEAKDS